MINKILLSLKNNFVRNYRGQILYNIFAYFYDFITRISWIINPKSKICSRKILKFKDKYKGKTCYIIGNGPSLRRTNLSLLKNKYTFGLNRIYLYFNRMGFVPTFLVSVNDLVLSQFYKDFNKINTTKIFSWKGRNYIEMDKNTIFIRSLAMQNFSKDVAGGVWEGSTVTYVALQLAYYMGFKKVILVGVDHSFKSKGPAHKEVVANGPDRNHFSRKYFSEGYKWNLPDLKTSEYAFKMAKKEYEADGREILDATVGGKLRVFKKIDYKSLN